MILLIVKWLISFGCGLLAIQVIQTLDYQSFSYFLSSIIINPILFFLGAFSYFISILGFSSFIRSLIKQLYNWVVNHEKPTYTIFFNLLGLFCLLFMFKQSFWITSGILVLSLFYGMMSVGLKSDHDDQVDQREDE